jgi:hypothetical protein
MRSRADIAKTATGIFLQDLGAAYDDARVLGSVRQEQHLREIADFFDGRCC